MRWFALLVLIASTLGVCAEKNASAQSVSKDDTLLLYQKDPVSQQFHEFIENASFSAAFSGCGLCQQTGQCDHAFRGQPGQFCLSMASGAPCCCPLDAQCVANRYECRCRRVVPTYGNNGGEYHPPHAHSSGMSGIFIFFALMLLCCICCCYLPTRRARQEREQVAYAQPVGPYQYGTNGGQEQVPYAYPSGPPRYETPSYREGGGGTNPMAAGALGALGGLGVGAALGSMYGGRDHDNDGYRGNVGGVSDNTYTFSGDTGGGDFEGNCDDVGTFAGDSY